MGYTFPFTFYGRPISTYVNLYEKNKLMSHGGVDSLEIGHANRLVDSSSSDTLRHGGLFTGDFS